MFCACSHTTRTPQGVPSTKSFACAAVSDKPIPSRFIFLNTGLAFGAHFHCFRVACTSTQVKVTFYGRCHVHHELAMCVGLQCQPAYTQIKVVHNVQDVRMVRTQHDRQHERKMGVVGVVVCVSHADVDEREGGVRVCFRVLNEWCQGTEKSFTETFIGNRLGVLLRRWWWW